MRASMTLIAVAVACLVAGAAAGIPSGKVIELTEANFDDQVRPSLDLANPFVSFWFFGY